MTIADWTGALGVFLILLAYFLNVNGRLHSDGKAFLLLNLAGATLACLASLMINYIPFVVLEGAWAAVSLAALVRVLRK